MTDWALIFTALLFDIEVVIHEVWALDKSVYRKGPMALITYVRVVTIAEETFRT